jgi:hypothetical protein
MRKLFLPLFVVAGLLSACEVTVNEGSSEESSEEVVQNGFSYDELTRTMNGVFPLENESIVAGEYLVIEFEGVQDAVQKDGYQHVGIGLQVYSPDGELIEESEDLLANIEQQDPLNDRYHFYYGVPKEFAGQSITVEYSLFDKYGDQSYSFIDEIEVVDEMPPITENVKIETSLENELYPQVFEGEYQTEVAPVEVGGTFDLEMFINNISGFETDWNGDLNLAYNIIIVDEYGEMVFEKEDVIIGNVEDQDNYPLTFSLSFNNMDAGNYIWKITTKDNLGSHYLNAAVKFVVK